MVLRYAVAAPRVKSLRSAANLQVPAGIAVSLALVVILTVFRILDWPHHAPARLAARENGVTVSVEEVDRDVD